MPDPFVPLAIYLRSEAAQTNASEIEIEPHRQEPDAVRDDQPDAFREARRFYAALGDALDAAREDLLRDFAAEVLGRELSLSPVDVECIARNALERLREERPLKLRLHPQDLPSAERLEIPIVPDTTLRRGDIVFELQFGSIDLTFGTRLSSVLYGLRA